VLADLYPLLPEDLPPIIAEKLEQLERAELYLNVARATNPK
jgi:hypothetical protein